MSPFKNVLNTTPKKMGSPDPMIVFSVLIIVMILVCDFLATLW
jgi:low affinity Fe/Cu permease